MSLPPKEVLKAFHSAVDGQQLSSGALYEVSQATNSIQGVIVLRAYTFAATGDGIDECESPKSQGWEQVRREHNDQDWKHENGLKSQQSKARGAIAHGICLEAFQRPPSHKPVR